MAKVSKRVKAVQAKVEPRKLYPAPDALNLVKECATAKFDESVDVAVQLGIDARKSDQLVRGSVVLPEGTGKTVRVAVFTQGPKADEARAAGADIVGMEDLAEQVKAGNLNFGLEQSNLLPGGAGQFMAALDADMVSSASWRCVRSSA